MNILIATDGSPDALTSIRLLTRLPLSTDCRAKIVHVLELPPTEVWQTAEEVPPAQFDDRLDKMLRARAEAILEEARAILQPKNWDLQTEILRGKAADQVVLQAANTRAELIVIGSRGLGPIRSLFLGSTSLQVARHAGCSVLLGRGRVPAKDPPRILLGFDASPTSWKAVQKIGKMGAQGALEVDVLAVVAVITYFRMDIVQHLDPLWQKERKRLERELHAAASYLREAGATVQTHLEEADDVATRILERAEKSNADLIVVGDKGRGAVDRFVIGSVSDKVMNHAKISLLLVK